MAASKSSVISCFERLTFFSVSRAYVPTTLRTLYSLPVNGSNKRHHFSQHVVQKDAPSISSSIRFSTCGCAYRSSSSGREGSSVNKKDSGKTYEHGSVLTQFVEKEGEPKHLTTAKKVVEAGKDAGYMGIILAGLGFTGFLMWAVLSEFFSSNSPQKLFAKALRAVKNNEQAREILGDPISGFGDTSGRGRRRRISSQEYVVNGEEHMRIVFYVAGSRRKGTAHMDLKKNENGKYICRYLVIELEGYPSAAITIEDNR